MSVNKNPFVGLRPFESKDSLFYFGRSQQTGELLEYLHRTRFLAVVGSSGSGKSSLVRAGLIPALEAGFLVRDCDLWHVAAMKPGGRPLYNLADALLHAVGEKLSNEQVSQFAEAIGDNGIHAVLERLTPMLIEEESNLFLLVDQFEEVFRFGVYTEESVKREEASVFVDLLLRLAQQDDIPVYVCLTMRSDYIGDCDMFLGLPETMNRSQYLVPRLTRSQRREAIEGPVRLSGASIALRLLDRLLNESGENRDDLPILQHALMRTWNEWAKEGEGPIDTGHYEKIKTMKRALSQHADEALNELPRWEKHLTKRLFQTLTETDAGNRRIRRSVHLNDIAEVINSPIETVMRIIGKFREESRLFLMLSSEAAADNPLVDISHESLMRQWDTLGDWMDEEAESAKIYKRLAEEAELYKQGKAGLYTDPALQIAMDWKEKEKPSGAWAKRYHKGFDEAMEFLNESRTAREKKIRKDKNEKKRRERLRREKADILEKQAQQQQKSLRQNRIFTIVVFILLVIAVLLAYLALDRTREANIQAEIAKNQAQIAKNQAQIAKNQAQIANRQTLAANYNLAKVFEEKAMNALKSAQEQNSVTGYKEVWLYTAAALKQDIHKNKFHLRSDSVGELLTPGVVEVAFSEKWFSPSSDAQHGPVFSVAFCPDGKTLASGSFDKTIHLWEVSSGEELGKFTGHSMPVTSVAFCPDGKTIASGSLDKTIRLWEVESGKEILKLIGHSKMVTSVAFCPEGKTIASGSHDTTIRLWEVASGKEIGKLTGHSSVVNSVAFSPDGKTIASGSGDNTIRLWEVSSGKEVGKLIGHSSEVNSVAFSPDGKTIVSGSSDKTIRLWEVSSGKEVGKLTGHSNWVLSVAFSPDGKIIASGSGDNTIRLWDLTHLSTVKGIGKLTGHSNWVISVAFSHDGKTIASGSGDNTIRLWDVASGKEIGKLTGHSNWVLSVAFSPDGKTIASGSRDTTIRLWDVASEEEIGELTGHSGFVNSVAFSPDGRTMASGSDDTTIRLWDVASGKEIRKLTGHSKMVTSVAFSPDGKTIASGSRDTTIRLWDVVSGEEIGELIGHSGFVNSVAFSFDGKTIASGSFDTTIRLWDVASSKEIQKLTGHSSIVNSVAFSLDGKTIASGIDDDTIRLWDVVSGKEIGKLTGHSRNVNSVVFSPDGKIIASGSYDRTIRLWDMSIFYLFIKGGKPTPLFYTFSEGAEFFWGVELEGLEYKKWRVPGKPNARDNDKRFRPLLDPPAPGQSKFDQILEWAKKEIESSR